MKIALWSRIFVFAFCTLSFGLVAQTAPSATQTANMATPRVLSKAPRKLALLIGISHYDRGRGEDKDWWNLNCATDIATMKRVLETRFGFADKDVLVLTDSKATKKGILDAFQHHLIDQARPGDVVVFHYSGHGQQVPDPNKRKMNGMHQAMVPFDYIDQSASNGLKADLLDDNMRDSLRRLKTKMQGAGGKVQGNITVFLDSCFSGSATRGGKKYKGRGRGWDPKIDGPKPSVQTRDGSKTSSDSGLLDKNEILAQGYVVITATRSDQVAQETENDQKQPMGALTFYLAKALSNATPQTTYRALFEKVSAQVESAVDNQNPQIEGDADKLLFSGTAVPVKNYIVVQKAQGSTLTLPTGTLQGATKGSAYAIYRAGSDVNDAKNKIADAEISSVDEFSSQAKLGVEYSKVKSADLLAARAVETAHNFGDDTLKVFLDGSGDWVQTLKTAQSSNDAETTLGVMKTEGVTADNCDVSIRQVKNSQGASQLEVQRRSDQQIVARLNNDGDMLKQMNKALNGEWRWRYLNRLGDSSADNSLLQIEIQIVPIKSAKDETPRTDLKPTAGGRFMFHDGDAYMLKWRNLSPVDAYVSVLDLPSDGTINAVFPPTDIASGELNRIPADNQWHLIKGFIWTASAPFGRETWKAIATREPADFKPLLLQKQTLSDGQILCTTTRGGAPTNPLSKMLLSSRTGRRGSTPVPPTSWTTSQVTFEVAPLSPAPAGTSAP